ncbi:murein biosynthesis integral membrane protein MurJ [Nocardioides sp.]|uniref:murein biosynthesis integral membrane protein MurJ n=1 Tax=Nocardioides sp. TaxID=35761 RepID=UPI003511F638
MSTAPSAGEGPSVLASSAVMAAGTIVSRLSGFVRSALLAAALGASLHADVFTIANTVPNMLYILLAGGVFNAVLVPQLVRAMKQDEDGGRAYTDRVITAAAGFLLLVTVALVVAAPWLMQLFVGWADDPTRAAQFDSVVAFARFCLPQVFFYGMFVLVGQVLNARGAFGPMMWAPIANNVISVAVLVVYLVVFGPAQGAEVVGPFSADQELLLGLGSTLGIVAQLLILLPYLRRAGVRYRPRFDLRGTGLGHTLRLGVWTVLFVIVNQVAYTVVVRLASDGSAGGGTGYTIYSSTFLIVMVPHSVITVSLATAVLPRLSAAAAEGDLARLATSIGSVLRTALAVIVPFAAVLPFVARDVSQVIWGYGAAADAFAQYAPTLALFGPAVVFFTVHYLVLRGFYALELTRTVFWIQCVVAGTNILAASALVATTDAEATAPALVVAYLVSYAVGAAVSGVVLRRRLGAAATGATGAAEEREPTHYGLRLGVVAALGAVVAGGTSWLLDELVPDPVLAVAGLRAAAVGLLAVGVMLATARAVQLREVTEVLDQVTRRFRRTRRA